MTSSFMRVLRSGSVALAALALAGGTAAAASASTHQTLTRPSAAPRSEPQPRVSPRIPDGTLPASFYAARKAGVNAPANIIDCSTDFQVPHKSTHDPTTVNVVAKVTCTQAVPKISVDVALYRNGALVAQSGYQSASNTTSKQVNAAAACINDLYGSWRGFTIVFPSGYVPQTASWPPSSDISLGFGPANQVTNC